MLKITTAILTASLATACISGDDENDEGETGDDLARAQPVELEVLARIHLPHAELVFSRDPVAGGLVTSTTYERDEAGGYRLLDPNLSPLELYLAVTPDGTPVPTALADHETRLELAAKVRARPAHDPLAAPVIAQGTVENGFYAGWFPGEKYCDDGTTSGDFSDEMCSKYDFYPASYCHNGTWTSVTDDIGSNKMKMSRSLTLGCGANGHVGHYYKSGGIWYKPIDTDTSPSRVVEHSYTGTLKLQRKITHNREASGFVRAGSFFRN